MLVMMVAAPVVVAMVAVTVTVTVTVVVAASFVFIVGVGMPGGDRRCIAAPAAVCVTTVAVITTRRIRFHCALLAHDLPLSPT